MLELVRPVVAVLARRFCGRAVLKVENLALRHQLHVRRRQRPGRLRLITFDRWSARPLVAALSRHDGVGQAGPPLSNGTIRASASFGLGVRDPDAHRYIEKFESDSADEQRQTPLGAPRIGSMVNCSSSASKSAKRPSLTERGPFHKIGASGSILVWKSPAACIKCSALCASVASRIAPTLTHGITKPHPRG